jgi:large subunit ribosomal protein L6
MSRIGKKPIAVPSGVEVSIAGNVVTVKGPQGTLTRSFGHKVSVSMDAGIITAKPLRNDGDSLALWGTTIAHVSNMINGVTTHFQKKLIIEGIGFKSEVKGTELLLSLGFSHPVKVAIPKDLKVTAEKNVLTISGADVEKVGQFAAEIRDLKKPEPYKGKGIRYHDEVIRRKQGKKTA